MNGQTHYQTCYLDNAATTPADQRVIDAMLPFFSEDFANPSSRHSPGLKAKQSLDQARKDTAQFLNCKASEVTFTSGGTESNNLAILGAARANKAKGQHLITSAIEHNSVLNCFRHLEKEGFTVTYLKPDSEGIIEPQKIQEALRPDTILTSIIYANNEIGTIQDIPEIAKICQANGTLFHTDACQSTNYLSLNVHELNVDLLTINGSKIYGPKGVGALYIKQGTELEAIIHGGGQEKNLRSGTENLPAIIGFAKALELIDLKETDRQAQLRNKLYQSILQKFPTTKLNGHPTKTLPNILNLTFPGISSDELILHLDEAGIYCSSASACSSKSSDPSHVLLALGHTPEEAFSSIRLSLGKHTTEKEIDYCATNLLKILQAL